MKKSMLRRVFAALLAMALLIGYIPATGMSAEAAPDLIQTVADPETLTRPEAVYGDNTQNAGKVTVGKSVAAGNGTDVASVTVNKQKIDATDPDNFLITITQTAQVMGLSSESSVPLDVVFVLDTSGSMSGRASSMVSAANQAIATLMNANENNRVGVVAFSSSQYGGGTSNGAAANVLSSLAHYSDAAASTHLTWVNEYGSTDVWWASENYIAGRDTTGNAPARRHGANGGTNIQAGIIAGAELLATATGTTVTLEDGTVVNRMPFLVVLSDGQPTFTYSATNWYDPATTNEQGTGDSDDSDPGHAFITATTAAYWKAAITEHYYGANANEENRCYIYTIGVSLDSDPLASITMDPQTYFKEDSTNRYYSTLKGYWDKYKLENPAQFTVDVGSNYTYTASVIKNTQNYVLGKNADGTRTMYEGGLAYNDDYFNADTPADITDAFNQVVSSIQLKAISAPTKVTGSGDFSGYVNFYDTLGEYMEVKDMKGIVANGHYYQGKTFAQLLKSGANAEFNETFKRVITERMKLSASTKVTADQFIAAARSNSDGISNSVCWWGAEYDVGEEDIAMQVVGTAKDDSIAYIQGNKAPDGATHICRSYFFYGTAGNTVENPNHEYLYFVVRVQRSLEAPYQQTVVISAPASLLAMEKVAITKDANGSFTAAVTETDPARVVYEVGLRSDINPQNVRQMVSSQYTGEKTVGEGSVNYDPATGKYYFFTNDWNRGAEPDTHQRAMTRVTFDAAADNSFYAYQKDTPLLEKSGDTYVAYTGEAPKAGATLYYARTYYSWEGKTAVEGVYPATEEVAYIPVTIQSGEAASAHLYQDSTSKQWYVKAGTYTSATTVNGDEDAKRPGNVTGTAHNVKYVRNTTNQANSHYTVMLGNNGRLELTPDTTKTVSGTRPTDASIQLTDGSTVMIGDELTYTIKVVNNKDTAVDATVTDTVPKGTEFVSADPAVTPDADGGLTWNIEGLAANTTEYVSFTVKVTEKVLDEAVTSVTNTASIKIGNDPAYNTNTTTNPPSGKIVVDPNNQPLPAAGVQVGDTLVYRIRYANDTAADADVTITDIIPAGTRYLEGSASHKEYLQPIVNNTLTWIITGVGAGEGGVVSFRVIVDASAKTAIENEATIQVGRDGPKVKTNPTETVVKTGNLTLSKTVAVPANYPAADTEARQDTEFVLHVREVAGDLSGLYALDASSTVTGYTHVFFKNGRAYMADANTTDIDTEKVKEGLTIKHGQSLTILGLPTHANLAVSETLADEQRSAPITSGYTPSYSGDLEDDGTVDVPADATAAVNVTNTYAVTPAPFQLSGTKNITGILPQDLVFTFQSQRCNEQGVVETDAVTVSAAAEVKKGTNSGSFAFSERSFDTPGNYYYLISEYTQNPITGVTYDQTQYLLHIAVKDEGKGALTATHELRKKDEQGNFTVEVTGTNDLAVFNNAYAPLNTSITLTGKKTLSGRAQVAGEFDFVVKEGDTVVAYGANNANGTIVFQPISYDKVGEHTYTVTELPGNAPGVTYDTDSITVTVEVKDNNGQLVANVKQGSPAIEFQNAFEPTEVELSIIGQKHLVDEDNKAIALSGGEFSFQVTDSTGAVVSTGKNDANGKITFSPIGYVLADMADGNGGYLTDKEFTYTVSEVIPSVGRDPYMRYETDPVTVRVKVTYDPNSGVLTAAIAESSAGTVATPAAFTNIRFPSSIPVTPTGNKDTTGTQIPAGATFSFTVLSSDETGKAGEEVGTGLGNAQGEIVFSKLNFSTAGTYWFRIQETHAGQEVHGIKYDSKAYLMKVVVTHEDGQLKAAKPVYYKQDGEAWVETSDTIGFQNEYNAKGQLTVSAKKTLADRAMAAGEFAFRLVRQDNNHEITGILTDSQGTVQFATLYYDLKEFEGLTETTKTIHYKMSEVKGNLPGVIYDGKSYDVYVKLTHDATQGTILAELVDSNGAPLSETGITFNNEYAPQDTAATIQVTKKLDGRDPRFGEFSFQLYHVTDSGLQLVDTAANGANGDVIFQRHYYAANFPFASGSNTATVQYVVKEVNGGLGGVTYSTEAYGVQVVVKNNTETGRLEIESVKYYQYDTSTKSFGAEIVLAENEYVTFTNRYTAQEASVTPVATKELANRELQPNEFSFVVKEYANQQAGAVVSRGISNKDGSVTFTPIYYSDRPGADQSVSFYYEISEVPGSLPNITYSEAKFYLKVVVTDDGKGKLSAVESYYSDAGFTTEIQPNAVIFKNTFKVQDVLLQLEGTKELTGRPLKGSEFDFVVKDKATGAVVTYGSNTEDGRIVFGTISYSLADAGKTFTYEISELEPSNAAAAGITTDKTVHEVTVKVEHHSDGSLTATPTYPEGGLKFTNKYDPADVSVTVQAWKHLLNKNLQNEEFSFQLLDKDGKVVETAKNNADGLVQFKALPFDKPDTYLYTVREVQADESKYQSDASVFQVKVVVRDNYTGALQAQVTYSKNGQAVDTMEFINSYKVPALEKDLSSNINATKKVESPVEYGLAGFQFEVIDVTGAVKSEGVSDAEGKITFEPFQFDAAGTYNYRIQEVLKDLPAGVTGDTRQWRLQIHVRYNEDTGLLYIEDTDVHVRDLNSQAASADFVNYYDPAPATVTVSVTKKLEGRDLMAGDFLFRLMEGSLIRDEVRNGAEGHVNFNLIYDKPGTYRYKIVEVNEGKKGITYSENTETVTVYVKDENLDGKLEAYASFGSDKDQVFQNSYKPQETKAVFSLQKHVDVIAGSSFVLSGGEFTFQVLDEAGNVVAEAKNDAAGLVTFEIPYTAELLGDSQEKLFHYTVRELIPEDGKKMPGIVYDETEHKVDVLVKDDLAGSLVTEVTYPDSQGAVPSFQNKYVITGTGMVKIQGTKTYTDAQGNAMTMEAGAFSFGLYEDGKLVGEAVKNDAQGNFTFVLNYTTADIGEHTYTLKEIAGTNPSIAYDKTAYTVTVTVADNKTGGLAVSYAVKDQKDNAVQFKNVYHEPDVLDVTIAIQKEMVNKTKPGITAEGFTMVLKQSQSENTDTTDKNGKASFVLRFDAEDIGKTFQMQVYEKKGTKTGVTYDKTVYDVTIQVAQNADGSLKAIINGKEADSIDLKFTNTYTAPYTPPTGDSSMIYPVAALMVLSAMACGCVFELLRRKRSSGKYSR